MTTAFIIKCDENHIVVVLRTPWCSNSIQFEDLVNFWQLKNDAGFGWYKVKQDAMLVQMDRTRGSSVALSHQDQLELLVNPWNKAFSTETNLRAWAKGGFGRDGITQKPLWLQKVKDDNKNVEQRARSNHEKRANAKVTHALSKEYDFDRTLKAPNLWKRGITDLQNEQNEDTRHEGQEEGEGDDDNPATLRERERRTTKSITAELQLLRVPQTSWPGRKVKNFHDWIAEIKAYKADDVKERMTMLMPEIEYKRMDQGKAYLTKYLELEYNKEAMYNHERLVTHTFEAYPKLNDKIQVEWAAIFGAPSGQKAKVAEKKKAPMPKHDQFGFGAYMSQSGVRAIAAESTAMPSALVSQGAAGQIATAVAQAVISVNGAAAAADVASHTTGAVATNKPVDGGNNAPHKERSPNTDCAPAPRTEARRTKATAVARAVVSVDKATAASGANHTAGGVAATEAVDGGTNTLQLNNCSYRELYQLCRKRSLATTGSKDDLRLRLGSTGSGGEHSLNAQKRPCSKGGRAAKRS